MAPPPDPSTSASPKTVSASSYLHIAPSSTSTKPFSPDQLREFVIEYLCSACYPDTASAFAKEVKLSLKEAEAKQGWVGEGDAGEGRRSGAGEGDAQGGSSGRAFAEVPSRLSDKDGASSTAGSAMEGVEGGSTGTGTFVDAASTGFDPDGDDAMRGDDGDEAEDDIDDADELEEEREVRYSRSLHRNRTGRRNSKSVSFVSFEHDREVEEVDLPLLSRRDLRDVRIRKVIREHLLNGRISFAIELIQEHFPAVFLAVSPSPSLAVPPLPYVPFSSKPNPCSPNEFFVLTPSAQPLSTLSSTSSSVAVSHGNHSSTPLSTFPPSAISLAPHIISLNLQIQSFVELMRSSNVSPSTPADSPPSSTFRPLDSSTATINLSASNSSIQSTRSSFLSKAIAESQSIQKNVSALKVERERDEWEKECVTVAGLLAYTDLKGCPNNVKGYLDQGRRKVLAELVDAAILQQTGKTPVSLLGMAARQTTAVWTALGEFKVSFPPSNSNSTAAGSGAAKDKSRNRSYPRFILAEFLSEKEVKSPDV